MFWSVANFNEKDLANRETLKRIIVCRIDR